MSLDTGARAALLRMAIALPAALGGACATNPVPRDNASAASAAEAVTRLTTVEWAQASARGDVAWFDRHLADELRLTTGRTGKVTGKAAEIASVRRSMGAGGGGDKIDDFQIRVYGDVAVATFALDTTGTDETGPYHRLARYTEVWVFRESRWQLAASHSSLLPR